MIRSTRATASPRPLKGRAAAPAVPNSFRKTTSATPSYAKAAVGQARAPAWRSSCAAAPRTVCRASPLDKFREMMGGAQPVVQEQEEAHDLGEMAPLEGLNTPAGTEDVFGPTAILMVGFMRDEVETFSSVLADMGADMVEVVPAGPAAMQRSLKEVLEGGAVPYEQPPLGQRRAVIMSGLYTSELLEVISGYKDAGLPPTVFAAAVPNNFERPIGEVVDSCWKDQMIAQQRAAIGKMEASIEDA